MMQGLFYLFASSSPALMDAFNRVKDDRPWLIAVGTIVVTVAMLPGFRARVADALDRLVSWLLMERTVVISSNTPSAKPNSQDRSQQALVDAVLKYVATRFPDHAKRVGLRASFKKLTRKDGEEFSVLECVKVIGSGSCDAVYVAPLRVHLAVEVKDVVVSSDDPSLDSPYGRRNGHRYGASGSGNNSGAAAAARQQQQVVTLKAYGPGAMGRVEELVQECVSAYNKEQSINHSGKPCVWKPYMSDDGDVCFRKIEQSESRGVRSPKYACPFRAQVRAHLQAMTEKRRDTLGMLLHGPPGTGKTSFVRWLAEETGRDVVCLKLSMFSRQPRLLEDLLLRGVFFTEDQGNVTVPIGEVIFLMDECDDINNIATRSRKPATHPGKNSNSPSATSNPRFESAAEQAKHDLMEAHVLTLPTLLEIVDGLVVVSDRIIVMTTNRPDILDAALLRPGRMGDFNICLPFVCAAQASELIEAQFQLPLDGAQADRIDEICSRRCVTLALIYSKLSHCLTVDEVLDALARDAAAA